MSRSCSSKAPFTFSKHLSAFLQKSSCLFIETRFFTRNHIVCSFIMINTWMFVEEIQTLHHSRLGFNVHLLKSLKGRWTDTRYMSIKLYEKERKSFLHQTGTKTSQLTLEVCGRTNSGYLYCLKYLFDFRASCSFNRPGLKLKTIPPLAFLFPALMTELFP